MTMPASRSPVWVKEIEKELESYPRAQCYLVGVSGGVDSRVLLQILLDTGFNNLAICHLDHRLRGVASEEENQFIRRLAGRLKLPVFEEQVDQWPPKLSLETAARHARHRFFSRAARKFATKQVFLGHHADDQVETFLLNILRGTGSIGHAAMRNETRIMVDGTELIFLRPLLHIWKTDIREFAKKRRLQSFEDASNIENRFTRNRIRNLLIPEIERILGRPFKANLLRLSDIAAEESELLRQLTPSWWELAELPVRDLRQLPMALQRRVVHLWLTRWQICDVGFEEVDRVRSLLTQQEIAKVNLPAGSCCRRRAGKLFLAAQKEGEATKLQPQMNADGRQ